MKSEGATRREHIHERWCLWLGEASPDDLRNMPKVIERGEAVRKCRLQSKSAPTRKLADLPTRFHVENIPDAPFLVIPEVSSEKRQFITLLLHVSIKEVPLVSAIDGKIIKGELATVLQQTDTKP